MNLPDDALGFDLWHEDGLLTGDELAVLVDLSRTPIVFTVRGIRHFAPRFRHVGVDIASLQTAEEFSAARRLWDEVEFALLQARIADAPDREHQALRAALHGDADAFEASVRALEHRQRAQLRVVPPLPRPHSPGNARA